MGAAELLGFTERGRKARRVRYALGPLLSAETRYQEIFFFLFLPFLSVARYGSLLFLGLVSSRAPARSPEEQIIRA